MWHIFVGALINGIAWATDFPVRRTIIGFIAGEKRVGSAMSLDSATTNVTRMTGPMLGGLLYETIGLPGAFAVAAGCYGICAVIAMLTHGGAGEGARSKASGEQEGFFASLKAGLSGLRGRDGLIAVLAVTVAMNLFGFPYAALIPALGEHRFQIDAFLTGVLMSAEGMGATIGAFVIAGLFHWCTDVPQFHHGHVTDFVIFLGLGCVDPRWFWARRVWQHAEHAGLPLGTAGGAVENDGIGLGLYWSRPPWPAARRLAWRYFWHRNRAYGDVGMGISRDARHHRAVKPSALGQHRLV